MTNDDDMMIREAARRICAAQAEKQDIEDCENWWAYLSGEWDHAVWMRLTEEGIRRGIQIGRSL